MVKEAKEIYDGLKKGTLYGATKGQHFSLAFIQHIVQTENMARVGTPVVLYSKSVQATNKGLAQLIVFPDRSGIYFKEICENSNEYTLESMVPNVAKSIDSAKKYAVPYRYRDAAGNFAGGRRRKISRRRGRIEVSKKQSISNSRLLVF